MTAKSKTRSSASRRCLSPRAAVALAALALAPPLAAQRAAYEELQTFSGILRHIQLNYVDSVTYGDLVPAAIRGMLRALDPHSHFVSRVDWERLNALERGTLAVTGVELESVEGAPTVLAVAPKSPAAKAGVLPGDRIAEINDTTVAGLDLKVVEIRLAGEEGSKVRVRLERGLRLEPQALTVRLKREFLKPRFVSIARMADATTGYVRLERFGPNAADEVRDALKRLDRRMERAILDLRGNPGGRVIEAVDLASLFLPRNTVVFRTRGRKRDVDTTYTTRRKGEFEWVPLIVLIDQHSASASEALAGSLQDHDRALLLGRRSFGKALMQTPLFVPSGDYVMLTVGYVLTPNGRLIQRRYRGLAAEQYRGFAGKTGAEDDTTKVFHTDNGREVRGGYGIAPDVVRPVAAEFPVWWSAASDSGFDHAVADSVAHLLAATPAARAAWMDGAADWHDRLVLPFLARVRTRLGVPAVTGDALGRRIAVNLAARVAEVRWGPEGLEEFVVRNDADVRAALDHLPRLAALLGPPGR